MKSVSLFSGIGGFEVGINNSNLNAEFVFSSEIDNHATASYLSNFSNNNLHGDITKISENKKNAGICTDRHCSQTLF